MTYPTHAKPTRWAPLHEAFEAALNGKKMVGASTRLVPVEDEDTKTDEAKPSED